MKINVVIGNPPYQESTGGGNNGGTVLYDKFITNGLSLIDNTGKLCMIVKNNWMYSDSLKELRKNIISSGLRTLVNYSLLGDIFPSMGISASIIYINKDTNADNKTVYIEIQKDEVISKYNEHIQGMPFIPSSINEYNIVKKITKHTKESFSKYVIGSNPFGIDTNGRTGKDSIIEDSMIRTEEYNIGLLYTDYMTYTNIKYINKNLELIKKYKIVCPKQIHKTNNPIPKVNGLKPDYIYVRVHIA